MTRAVRSRLIARVAARRRGEQGLTLIELLLSLAILAILTGFLAGGLSMARQAFGADRASEIGSETSAAIQTVAALVGSALPVRFDGAGPKDAIGFDGRGEAISFVGLSEGRSLRGGPQKVVLRRSGGDIVADFVALNGAAHSKENPEPAATRVVVLSGVREIRIGYFGTVDAKVKPAWRADWVRAERLPDLVSIRIEFKDERRNEPATIVALRQG
ncbi:prepilin-type N-terminal cleavage/methylation domain-containing protein [Bradyrhizobium sp. SRL28]|uniref:prepilin-type N-terminal cleavage/methylation domain-containing protein n=1 Tax=Bradyrhizobium sp. SRL28 TaxID=2836178 RepID=UPI001BDDD013|nr:prepilin-type N-terminal cleavage/methylation domain-containing protein [Bradyrhizobium sp. SRL28]MBT1515664.1 prepilin-type N-terminal cleavage/methylation domain-containing protein [Bradyrhizobium sp. SRL28]